MLAGNVKAIDFLSKTRGLLNIGEPEPAKVTEGPDETIDRKSEENRQLNTMVLYSAEPQDWFWDQDLLPPVPGEVAEKALQQQQQQLLQLQQPLTPLLGLGVRTGRWGRAVGPGERGNMCQKMQETKLFVWNFLFWQQGNM